MHNALKEEPGRRTLSSGRRRRRDLANRETGGLGRYPSASSPALAESAKIRIRRNSTKVEKINGREKRTCFGERILKLSPRVEAMESNRMESQRERERE